jgi:uncharacterized protein DUF6174
MTRTCRRLLLLMVVLGLASCSQQMPSQPQIGIPQPAPTAGTPSDSSLAANRARWSATGIQSYRYRFRWGCFCVSQYVREVEITVVRGTIVSVVDVATGQRLGAQAAAQYRTIEGLFDFVREAMNYPADRISVAFDPWLGCPVDANVDYVAGMADEEMAFHVLGFSPDPPR